MSDNRVEIRFQHRFSRQSNNGKAFGWLKDHLGNAYDDAITQAVRFVYLPIALASAGASCQDVETSVKKAREFLNEKMMAALGSCCEAKSNSSAPGNVEIKFEHRFSSKLDNGKAFGWLKDYLGNAYDDAITNVVRFVYLPVALAYAGASRQDVETEIKRAREFLNEKMMAALGSCCQPEQNSSASSNGSTPSGNLSKVGQPSSHHIDVSTHNSHSIEGCPTLDNRVVTPAPLRSIYLSDAHQEKEEPNSSNGASTQATAIATRPATSSSSTSEAVDDFLELDEDKLMEGF